MDKATPPRKNAPQAAADQVAQTFFGVGPDPDSRRRAIRGLLLGAVQVGLLVPYAFYLRFGEVGPMGWGTTVFFVAYCILAAIGLYFGPRTEFHTTVALRGDWADHVGAFWLVSCAFGPFLGWIVTSAFPITADSWRWLYGLRVFLAAGIPILTALPLTRYARGKAAWVAVPLLVGVTLLPIWSAVRVSQDLRDGPIVQRLRASGESRLYLPHSQQRIEVAR